MSRARTEITLVIQVTDYPCIVSDHALDQRLARAPTVRRCSEWRFAGMVAADGPITRLAYRTEVRQVSPSENPT